MRAKSILSATAVLLLCGMAGGCASTNTSLPLNDVSLPPLNTSTTAYLGERLLMQARGFRTDVLRVQSVQGKFVRVNDQMFCRRQPGDEEFVSFNHSAVHFLNFLGGTRSFTNKVTYSNGEVCFSDIWSGCFQPSQATYTLQTSAMCTSPNEIQQIIEYNGKNGNTLNFTYREVYGNRVSSPVTQNFTMDLNSGKEITYKGARLRIDRASNEEITYAVLRNFTSP